MALRRNKANKATKAGNVEKLAEHGVQEVQVYSKEMVFISSLAPAAKLQFRQGNKELICKHLSGSKGGWLSFYCLQMDDWAPEHGVQAPHGGFLPVKQSEAPQPGLPITAQKHLP